MPTLEEILPRLARPRYSPLFKVFSTLDAKDGFIRLVWVLPMCYLPILFGVSLAPEEFECKLHKTLDDLPGIVVLQKNILVMGYREIQEVMVTPTKTSSKSKRNQLEAEQIQD